MDEWLRQSKHGSPFVVCRPMVRSQIITHRRTTTFVWQYLTRT